jgi:type VI secretion system ImpC/EvpB family protein
MDRTGNDWNAAVFPPDLEPGAAVPPSRNDHALERSLLDALLETRCRADASLDQFLAEPSPWRALGLWLARSDRPVGPFTRERVVRMLLRDIARLDAMLSCQVNAIIHNPRFQKLEASWRGLRYLVEQAAEGENIKVRVLTLTWKELTRDLERALEFDQSQLFQKVYSEEFGMPGGEPFGVLLGDFELRPRPGSDHPFDDLAALQGLAAVAAAAFAPFVAGLHPSFLELDNFTELERPLNLAKTFDQLHYLKWRALRDTEDARFVGLTLPRVLARLPYRDDGSRKDAFRFREEVGEPGGSKYLWGTAVYAFGAVLVRAFGECGWLADIRGVRRGELGGGLVTGLPAQPFVTDKPGIAPKPLTDALITDTQEKELGELGLIPLCHCPDTGLAAFYGNQSVQRPKGYDTKVATANARLSAMLQYMLCVARFAHYLKVIARDKVGSFGGPSECEEYLYRWLLGYTTSNDEAGLEDKAKYPLREVKLQIREHPGKPGTYYCVVHMRPHFQLDQVHTAVRLATELAPSQPR